MFRCGFEKQRGIIDLTNDWCDTMNRVFKWYEGHKLHVIIIFALVLGLAIIWLGSLLTNKRTGTETVCIQVIQLILTTIATILPTRVLAQRQEKKINENRAEMAVKRAVTLYNQMNQVAEHIEQQRLFIRAEAGEKASVKESLVENSFNTISGLHKMQYGVIEDIVSDWQDVMPDAIDRVQNHQNKEKR